MTIVRADVCRTFSTSSAEWRCDVVEGAVDPGRLVFYTRVRSASPLKIEHRWYHGDDLVQTVPLQIGANTGPGYRTYSQQTVVPSRRGTWRVELRGPNDEVMADVQFEVR